MSLNVKSLGLAIAVFASASALLGGALQAAPITYNVNQTIGAGSVVGTVETDGTLGVLGTANFIAWNLALKRGWRLLRHHRCR